MQLGFERPTPGQAMATGLLVLGAFVYPVLGEQVIASWGVAATASVLLGLALLSMLGRYAIDRRPLRLFGQNAGALVLLALAATSGERTFLLLFPALVNLYLCAIFAGSLATDRSIVERGARMLQPYLPPFTLAYCRNLTAFWAVFFVLNAIAISVVAIEAPELWRSYTVFVYAALVAGISAVEFLVRKVWFRNFGDGPFDRVLAVCFPPEANERGRRSQHYMATLRAAGYGPGGVRRGQPLDPAVVPEVF